MSQEIPDTPEDRLKQALLTAADEGVDVRKVVEQIPIAERSKVRSLLRGVLDATITTAPKIPSAPTILTPPSKDVLQLAEALRLEEAYREALETHKDFQLLRAGQRVPSFNRIMSVFTPEMLTGAKKFQRPRLTLCTRGRSFEDLISAIDAHRFLPRQGQVSVSCEPYRYKYVNGAHELPNWRAYIVEGPEEIGVHDFDRVENIISTRLTRFAEYKKASGVTGMDRWRYAQLIMQVFRQGEPIDTDAWTMLDEEPGSRGSYTVLRAGCPVTWGGNTPHFDFDSACYRNDDNSFRRSVGGIVPGT